MVIGRQDVPYYQLPNPNLALPCLLPAKLQDFMSPGSKGNKEQLKEMLSILNAGPKRPSFLDKPPITAVPAKKPPPKTATMSPREADQLLGLLECEQADEQRCGEQGCGCMHA